jgi:hypothetical protein
MPTAPMPTAPMPTAPMPTAPMPTAPMPTAEFGLEDVRSEVTACFGEVFGFEPRVRTIDAECEFGMGDRIFSLFQREVVLPIDRIARYADVVVGHARQENAYVVHVFSDLDVLTLTMSPRRHMRAYALRRWLGTIAEGKEERVRTKACVVCWERIYAEYDNVDDSVDCSTCLYALCFACYDRIHQHHRSHSPPACPHCRTPMVTSSTAHLYNREVQLAYELPHMTSDTRCVAGEERSAVRSVMV